MNSKAIIAAQSGIKERSSGLSVLMETPFLVLFILGKQDKEFPVDKIIAQALLLRHAEVIILGHATHMAMIEAQ